METPYMTAWREFSSSKEFRDACKPETLGGSNNERRTYLTNRLRNAFDAGWNAAEAPAPAQDGEQA